MKAKTAQRAAIYTRISRDVQGQGLGVERQLEDCRKLATSLKVTVVGEYSDNDISAFSGRKRHGYERLLTDIEQGRVDVVICWNIDRLLRQSKELERYIDLCRPRDVSTHEVTAGRLDLTTPSGRATAKTRGAWAQFESEHKAERIQRQKAQAAKAGKYLGGRVPWGWKKSGAMIDDRGRELGGTIVIDEAAASLIRSGTESIVAGRSLIGVTRDWADAGALSLSGTRMNTTQVRRVLLRPRNAGLTTFHGEIVSDTWPAIVTLDLFRKMEAVLTSADRPRQSESKFRYLLSGIAKCHCGRRVTGFGVDGKRSYRCSVHQEGGRFVQGHTQRAMGSLDEYVAGVVVAYLGREDVKARVLAGMQKNADESKPVASTDITALLDRKHTLARLFAQGMIGESQLVEGSREVQSKLAQLESMARSNGGSTGLASVIVADDPGAAFLQAGMDIQREVLRELVDVVLKPSGPYRGFFDASTLELTWKAGMK